MYYLIYSEAVQKGNLDLVPYRRMSAWILTDYQYNCNFLATKSSTIATPFFNTPLKANNTKAPIWVI